jgi:hypothetical protein
VLGFAAFAIDLGYCYVKKVQMQNAADSAALAGASALVSYGEDLETVRNIAVDYARKNLSTEDLPELAISGNDVVFYRDGVQVTEDANEVEVTVRRTAASGNPLSLFLARVMGHESADVVATSRARCFKVTGTRCLKPFAVPQKFKWDDSCDTGTKYCNNGEFDTASACEKESIEILEWNASDVGRALTLKVGDPEDTIVPSHYNAVDYPPVNKGAPATGASAYRLNIAGCDGSNNTLVEKDDEIQLEPGNMVGPTNQGVKELIAEDPGAYWDEAENKIAGSAYDDPMASPRVMIVPFYDPRRPPVSGRNSIYVESFGAFFAEDTRGAGEVIGRLIEAFAKNPASAEENSLLYSVRLVVR